MIVVGLLTILFFTAELNALTEEDVERDRKVVSRDRSIFTYVIRRRDGSDGDKVSREYVCPEGTWLGYHHTILQLKSPNCVADFTPESKLSRSHAYGYMVGARFRLALTDSYTNYGKYFEIHELVEQRFLYGGIERIWRKYQSQSILTPEIHPDGWGHDLICPWLTAMCSVQFEYRILDGVTVFTNIRFGCCDVPTPKLNNTTPFTFLELQNDGPFLSRITASPFHFPVNIIPNYYTNQKLFKCPVGQFIDVFQVNVRLHRRITYSKFEDSEPMVFLHSSFFCNTFSKEFPSSPLTTNLYKWGSKYDGGGERDLIKKLDRTNCEDGFFSGVRLSINSYVSWEKEMYCSSSKQWIGDTWKLPEDDVNPETGAYIGPAIPGIRRGTTYRRYKGGIGEAMCGEGEAICGVEATFPSDDSFTLEGYHFRYLCCAVPIAERCEAGTYKLERVSSGCPTSRVNKDTYCTMDCVRGVSRTKSNSKSGSKASKVSHSFGIEVAAEIKNVGGATGKYAYTFGDSQVRNWGTDTDETASNSTTISIKHHIPSGSQLIVAQPRIKCNDYLIRADQAITYSTPPSACIPKDEYRKLKISYEDILEWKKSGQFKYTSNGYGMALSDYVPPTKELNVTWEELIGDVPNAFRTNGDIINHKYTDFNWQRADKSLWEKYDPNQKVVFVFRIQGANEKKFRPALYQVIGTCGNWIVNTRDIRMTIKDEDLINRKFVYPSARGA